MIKGTISRVSAPVIIAKGMIGSKMYDVVHVGTEALRGEIIRLEGDEAVIQVVRGQDRPRHTWGERRRQGSPLSVGLGPGFLSPTMAGVQRPAVETPQKRAGTSSGRGIHRPKPLTAQRSGSLFPQ